MFILGKISVIKKTAYGVSEGRKYPTDPRSRLGRTPGQCLQKHAKTLPTLRISLGLLRENPIAVLSAFAAHLGEPTGEDDPTHSVLYGAGISDH